MTYGMGPSYYYRYARMVLDLTVHFVRASLSLVYVVVLVVVALAYIPGRPGKRICLLLRCLALFL